MEILLVEYEFVNVRSLLVQLGLLKSDLSHLYPWLTRTPNEWNRQCMCTMWCSKWKDGWIKGIHRRLTAIEPGWFLDACPVRSTRRLVLIITNPGYGITVMAKECSFYPKNNKAQVELNWTGHDDSTCGYYRSNKWVNSHQWNVTYDTNPMLPFSITTAHTYARLSPVYCNHRENEHRFRSIAQQRWKELGLSYALD